MEFWEAIQYPEKLIICVLQPLSNQAQRFIESLYATDEEREQHICHGIEKYVLFHRFSLLAFFLKFSSSIFSETLFHAFHSGDPFIIVFYNWTRISLIPKLSALICDDTDEAAYQWWRLQSIGGAGVPDQVVPNAKWTVPPCYVCHECDHRDNN